MTPTTDDYDQDRIRNDQVNIANAELHVSKMRKSTYTYTQWMHSRLRPTKQNRDAEVWEWDQHALYTLSQKQ